MIYSTDKDTVSELVQPYRPPQSRRCFSRLRGWRVTILAGACLTSLVMLVNIGLLIWAYRNAIESHSGILTLHRGQRQEMKKILTWSHLGINILSTLILSASTAGLQCVSMPTREELDEAHERGRWMHVGVLGLRNFFHISNWRRVVWILLAISSVPIHLLYNSIIFSTESSNDYNSFIVTPDFLTGGRWNVSDEYNFGYNSFLDYKDHWQIQSLQNDVNSLIRLGVSDCVDEFSPLSVSRWRNVLVVVTSTNSTNSLIYSMTHDADGVYDRPDSELVCRGNDCYVNSNISIIAGETHWQVVIKKTYPLLRTGNFTVDFCLAQELPPACTVDLSCPILITVILCNLIKLSCLITSLVMPGFEPLVTTGDAISTFLTRSDLTTVGFGTVSAVDIARFSSCQLGNRSYGQLSRPWKPVRHFWFAAATRWRWSVVLACCFAAWTGPLVLLLMYSEIDLRKPSFTIFKDWWAGGLGGGRSLELVTITKDQPITSNVLLANTPQLIVSMVYILYNGVFTSMLLTYENLGYATGRKALRVSKPSGAQRSTYWLQLPYRYAIPLMIAMSVLHWLISQSLFLICVAIRDSTGWQDPTRSVYGCGWSPLGLFFSIILGGLLIVNLIAHGFRRYTDKMPILSSCSLAISAACHRDPSEDDDMPLMPLQYGVLPTTVGLEQKAGFSARDVEPCVEGVVYH